MVRNRKKEYVCHFFSFSFAGALKALVCMLGRCQVAHTHYSFCTGKAAEGMGKKMERYPSIHAYDASQRQASTSHTGIEKSDEIFCRQNNSVRLPSMPLRFSHTLFIFQLAEKVAPSCFNCIGEKKGRKKNKKNRIGLRTNHKAN